MHDPASDPPPGPDGKKAYFAFLSYSHSDERFATRLHRFLETWKTPKRLIGQANRDGKVPGRLFPVFRDREELPTSADLGGVIRAALEGSRYLVVICSPRAARSQWVNQEVHEFKRLHGEGRVIAALIEGDPAESFPPALQYALNADGTLSDTPTEPIAADFRRGKDEWRKGTLKILAGLLGVDFDDLAQREKQRRTRRRMLAGAGAMLVCAGLGFASWTWTQTQRHNNLRVVASRGLDDIRSGDLAIGADRFLNAVAAMGRAADPAHQRYAMALRSRLTPLAVALADQPARSVAGWRGQSYYFGGAAPLSLPDADLYGHAGDRLILYSRTHGLLAYAPGTRQALWSLPLALEDGLSQGKLSSNDELCGIWFSPERDLLYIQGRYTGRTIGSSYGFVGGISMANGQSLLEESGYDAVCQTDQIPGLTRIDRAILPLRWPGFRNETPMWTPAKAIPRPPYLTEAERRKIRQDIVPEGDEWTPVFALSFLDRAARCDGRDLLIGYSIPGNSGGEWSICTGYTEGNCASQSYPGLARAYVAAPDCSMAVALGDRMATRRGFGILLASLKDGVLESARDSEYVTQGRFSPDGSYFAADTDLGLHIYQTTPDGLRFLAEHDTGGTISALGFLSGTHLAVLTEDGTLSALDVRSGQKLWPNLSLGPEISEALAAIAEADAEDHFKPVAAITADPGRGVFALSVTLPSERAYDAFPALAPRDDTGSRIYDMRGDGNSYLALLFDATLGTPVSGPLVLDALFEKDGSEDPWRNAHLGTDAAGALVLSYDPGGALVSGLPGPGAHSVADLTGQANGAPLLVLPGSQPFAR